MAYDTSQIVLGTNNQVQLGPGQFVPLNSLSDDGYKMAMNYKAARDGGAAASPAPATTIATPPQSDPSRPSSSASFTMNQNANSAVSNAQNPPANPSDTTISAISSAFPSLSADMLKSLDPTTLVNLALAADQKGQAAKDKSDAEARQQDQYRATMAQNNAAYAAARDQLKQDRENSVSTASAQLASLNSSGGIGSDSSQYIDHIHSMYDMAENQLQLQAEQAQAALDAGNSQAYEQISQNMSNTVSTITANVQNMLATIQGQKVQASQFAQTEQDKATTTYSSMLQNLPQPDVLSNLPSDYGSLSKDQLSTLQNTSAYQQGIKAGMSPQAILSDIKAAATSSKVAIAKQNADEKAQNDAVRAQIAMFNAQTNAADKMAAAADAQRIATTNVSTPNGGTGSDFLEAFKIAQNAGGHTKQENNDSLNNIADFLEAGKTDQAKQALQNYVLKGMPTADRQVAQGFMDVSGFAKEIQKELAALPADKQTGLINGKLNDVAEKLGQTTDPQLAQLKASVDHFKVAYTTLLAGRRGNSQYTNMIGQLLPSTSDNPDLNAAKIAAIANTSDTFMRSAVGGIIGSDTYDKIYGTKSSSTNNTSSSGYVPSFDYTTYINNLPSVKANKK